MSDYRSNEYGGGIYGYTDENGIPKYGYTIWRGVKGPDDVGHTPMDMSPGLPNMIPWHTHFPTGNGRENYENQFFSTKEAAERVGLRQSYRKNFDIDEFKRNQLTGGAYLITPFNELRYFPDPVRDARQHTVIHKY